MNAWRNEQDCRRKGREVKHWKRYHAPQQHCTSHNKQNKVLDYLDCSLCRSYEQSVNVLERAKQRPDPWQCEANPPECRNFSLRDEMRNRDCYSGPKTLRKAMEKLEHTLADTSRHCRDYYEGCSDVDGMTDRENEHRQRFHPSSSSCSLEKPKSKTYYHHTTSDGHVDLELCPGSYLISAGNLDTGKRERHIVSVCPGESVTMNFRV